MKPEVRCSSLDRLLTCHGSRTLERKLEEGLIDFSLQGDEMTWRGNWCHYESARRLIRDHGAIAPPGGLLPPVLPNGWKPSPWDERTVKWYVTQVVADLPAGHALFVEGSFRTEFDQFILTGHPDTYSISFDGLEFTIDEHKTGPNEVDPADENWQLAGYATQLKRKYPGLKHGRLRIRQRMAEVPTTTAEVDDLDMLGLYLESKVNDALRHWRILNTGYKACRLCPCIFFCPALAADFELMKKVLSDHDLATIDVAPSLKTLAELAQRGRVLAGPIERIMAELKRRVAAEGPVVLDDGTTARVVTALGKREVTAPKIAFEFLREELEKAGLEGDLLDIAAWETLSISLKDVEDTLVNAAGMQRKSVKEGKETAERWVKEKLGHLIRREPVQKLLFK